MARKDKNQEKIMNHLMNIYNTYDDEGIGYYDEETSMKLQDMGFVICGDSHNEDAEVAVQLTDKGLEFIGIEVENDENDEIDENNEVENEGDEMIEANEVKEVKIKGFNVVKLDFIPKPIKKARNSEFWDKYPIDDLEMGMSFFIECEGKSKAEVEEFRPTITKIITKANNKYRNKSVDGKIISVRKFIARFFEDGSQWGFPGKCGFAIIRVNIKNK